MARKIGGIKSAFTVCKRARPDDMWVDSMGGIVHARLLELSVDEWNVMTAKVRITGRGHKWYKAGEIATVPVTRLRPAGYIYVPRGGYFPHLLPYDWDARYQADLAARSPA